MNNLNEQNTRIHVFPEREGVLSPIGHDLVIHAEKLHGQLDGDSVRVDIPVADLRVVGNVARGIVDPTVPGEKDRRKIEENMRDDVLNAKKHATIVFQGTVNADAVVGTLTINGVSKPLQFEFRAGKAEVVIHQADFGIKPYKTFLGQLRIKPDVRVTIERIS